MLDLYRVRQAALIPLDDWVPRGWKLTTRFRESEYVGVWHTPIEDARRHLKGLDNVYVNNFASMKYMTPKYAPLKRDGDSRQGGTPKRVYEHGSYAYRPDGRFGKWQIHVRLFPHPNGCVVGAHREVNALSHPVLHHSGDTLDDEVGVEYVRNTLLADADATWNI